VRTLNVNQARAQFLNRVEVFVLNPLIYAPPRRVAPSGWLEHVPFAMYLVELLRPRLVVELGVHHGVSYCAFCQAVQTLGLTTRCVGIDTWQGDEQTGRYGPETYADLAQHHDALYAAFSRLHQSTFDEALPLFAADTIDLLHIDGCHTYEAARHDFTTWLPKMSGAGIVLLHDIHARRPGFGVWMLWEELRPSYPHFEFFHDHGLGVLAVGRCQPPTAASLFQATEQEAYRLRELFAHLGRSLRSRERLAQLLVLEQNRSQEVARLAAFEQERAQLAALRTALADREWAVQEIQKSRAWKLVQSLRRLRQLLPLLPNRAG
jgi:hypothetical protein